LRWGADSIRVYARERAISSCTRSKWASKNVRQVSNCRRRFLTYFHLYSRDSLAPHHTALPEGGQDSLEASDSAEHSDSSSVSDEAVAAEPEKKPGSSDPSPVPRATLVSKLSRDDFSKKVMIDKQVQSYHLRCEDCIKVLASYASYMKHTKKKHGKSHEEAVESFMTSFRSQEYHPGGCMDFIADLIKLSKEQSTTSREDYKKIIASYTPLLNHIGKSFGDNWVVPNADDLMDANLPLLALSWNNVTRSHTAARLPASLDSIKAKVAQHKRLESLDYARVFSILLALECLSINILQCSVEEIVSMVLNNDNVYMSSPLAFVRYCLFLI
jgi:hypothetical protein